MAEKPKKPPAQRELPHLPAATRDLPALSRAALLAGNPLEDVSVADLDISGERIDSLTASGIILERVSLANCEISSLRLRDVRFVGCDLSNALFRSLDATRVEFV